MSWLEVWSYEVQKQPCLQKFLKTYLRQFKEEKCKKKKKKEVCRPDGANEKVQALGQIAKTYNN